MQFSMALDFFIFPPNGSGATLSIIAVRLELKSGGVSFTNISTLAQCGNRIRAHSTKRGNRIGIGREPIN